VYSAHLFFVDFTTELQKRQYPRFGERPWWQALDAADEEDLQRLVIARNAEFDSDYFARQQANGYELSPFADEQGSRKDAWVRRWKIVC
jgi:hypothetical protein